MSIAMLEDELRRVRVQGGLHREACSQSVATLISKTLPEGTRPTEPRSSQRTPELLSLLQELHHPLTKGYDAG